MQVRHDKFFKVPCRGITRGKGSIGLALVGRGGIDAWGASAIESARVLGLDLGVAGQFDLQLDGMMVETLDSWEEQGSSSSLCELLGSECALWDGGGVERGVGGS